MIKIIGLYKRYKTKEDLFELNVDLEIKTPSFVVITGSSGSGKSTFAKVLSGLIPLDNGMIEIGGQNVESNVKEYVEYLEANEPLIDNFTIYQTLYSKGFHLYEKTELEERIKEIINQLNLNKIDNQKIMDLSGGEAQRVAIGCMLMSKKPIYILDEATHSLDKKNAEIIVNLLKKIKDKTIIYITHKKDEVEGIGDKYIEFKNGQIVQIEDVSDKEDKEIDKAEKGKTKILPIVKSNFFAGIKGHILTVLSYLLLFFLCTCFLSIGRFVSSVQEEGANWVDESTSPFGHGTFKDTGACYYVELHSSYDKHIYQNDIEELKNQFQPAEVLLNQITPGYFYLFSENKDAISLPLHYAPISEKDLIIGRLYNDKKELVLGVHKVDYNTNRKYYKSLLNKEINGYKIVGIINSHSSPYEKNFYASKESLEEYLELNPTENHYNLYLKIGDSSKKEITFTEEEFLNCVINPSLEENIILTSKIQETQIGKLYFRFGLFNVETEVKILPSENHLEMSQETYQKLVDEKMVDCTIFYFNTLKECRNFTQHLNEVGIKYRFQYLEYDKIIERVSYLGSALCILIAFITVGLLNRKINKKRDLFYNKCNYNRKSLILANVLSSLILLLISLGIYALVYVGLSQMKYHSIVTYYALRWMTVGYWFVFIGSAILLNIGMEFILQVIPKRKMR